MSAVVLASEIQVAQNIGFGVIAAIMVVGALKVVTSSNVVHAALALVLVLAGAVTQVLVYVGAVMVLFLFGVMLTRAKLGAETDLNNKHHLLGVPVALLLFGVMVWVLVDGFRDTKLPQGADAEPVSVQQVSDSIFSPYLLPFWALSFVLLAAVIGAIVLARKD
jgi:NADH-quinone oxidoreductase subunit J